MYSVKYAANVQNFFANAKELIFFFNQAIRQTLLCRVNQQVQDCAKLGIMFEEFLFWSVKIQFFPWSPVDFGLY